MADRVRSSRASFSIPSILALVCGILAFTSTAGWSLFAAVGAMVLGALGVILALLPRTRGGLVSGISILMGAAGFLLALLRLVF